jgi:four helix bundle protein
MAVRTYRELIAWQRGMDLVVEVYKATRQFPREELYGLTSQVRRAAVSIPSNIAEGQGRGVGAEFAHFLRISQGSVQELETQVMVGEQLGYLTTNDVNRLLVSSEEVGRLIRGLHQSI